MAKKGQEADEENDVHPLIAHIQKVRFWPRHKKLLAFVIICTLVLLILGGYRLFVETKFLLGYDLTIRVSANQNDFQLANSEKANIEISVEKVSKIFCLTTCDYSFRDLSSGELVSSGNFNFISQIPKKFDEELAAPNEKSGQKVYAFDISCRNKATAACKTDEANVTRRMLVTMEYSLSDEQKLLRQKAETKLAADYSAISTINATYNSIASQIESAGLDSALSTQTAKQLKDSLDNALIDFEDKLEAWKAEKYREIIDGSANSPEIENLRKDYDAFYSAILDETKDYNGLVGEIASVKQALENAKTFSMNQSRAEELNSVIDSFNNKVSDFKKEKSISGKSAKKEDITELNVSKFSSQAGESSYATREIGYNISEITLASAASNLTYNLPEQEKICCLDNECKTCEIQKKYPIILVHGHNFNSAISADNSINLFTKMQKKLEEAGYLNAGEFYLYESTRKNSGTLGTITKPIVALSSYYFDFMDKPEGYQSVQIKSENIETYAIRLRELIENIKFETGSEKVIIITHSMGGLVARKYVQIFGPQDVDRMILIASPNNGVSGKIKDYCDVFGAISECEDMSEDSLFINKLNTRDMPSVKTINIVGTGCLMDSKDGDGIVTKESAELNGDSIKNIEVSGQCSGVEFFHNDILDTNKYPQVFEEVKKGLA